jgi:hypothetical protein
MLFFRYPRPKKLRAQNIEHSNSKVQIFRATVPLDRVYRMIRVAMGVRNQVGIGLSHRPASLCSLATQFQTRFLELIPRPIAGLMFPTLVGCCCESLP